MWSPFFAQTKQDDEKAQIILYEKEIRLFDSVIISMQLLSLVNFFVFHATALVSLVLLLLNNCPAVTGTPFFLIRADRTTFKKALSSSPQLLVHNKPVFAPL